MEKFTIIVLVICALYYVINIVCDLFLKKKFSNDKKVEEYTIEDVKTVSIEDVENVNVPENYLCENKKSIDSDDEKTDIGALKKTVQPKRSKLKPQMSDQNYYTETIKNAWLQDYAKDNLLESLQQKILFDEVDIEIESPPYKTRLGNEIRFTNYFTNHGINDGEWGVEGEREIEVADFTTAIMNDKKFSYERLDFKMNEVINLLEGRFVQKNKVAEDENGFGDTCEGYFFIRDSKLLFYPFEKNLKYWSYINSDHGTYFSRGNADIDESSKALKAVEGSILKFNNEREKKDVIFRLERGDVVDVKYQSKKETKQGYAILSPIEGKLYLYDNQLNRISEKTMPVLKGILSFLNPFEPAPRTSYSPDPYEYINSDVNIKAGGFENQDTNTVKIPNQVSRTINDGNNKNFIPATNSCSYLTDEIQILLNYLGFGGSKQLDYCLKRFMNSDEKTLELQTKSESIKSGNIIQFSLKFSKNNQGKLSFDSYDCNLKTKDGKSREQYFMITNNYLITARSAVNLLEGRAAKTNFKNQKTGELESVFVKLRLNDEKNEKGGYKWEHYKEDNTLNAKKILDNYDLILNKEKHKQYFIKSLERGDITDIALRHSGKEIEAKAILNPQYKILNLYDENMVRINTNKAIQNEKVESAERKNIERGNNLYKR